MPERLYAPGLCKVTLLVPEGSVEILRQFARDLRARERAVPSAVTLGWRRLSPSAELSVDPESGAQCAIHVTGAPWDKAVSLDRHAVRRQPVNGGAHRGARGGTVAS
jgi:hypothetical protein